MSSYHWQSIEKSINSWLGKCGELRQLDQNFDYTVRYALKYSAKNGNIEVEVIRQPVQANQPVEHDVAKWNIKVVP